MMLRAKAPQQSSIEMVSLEQLVPKNHLLRVIDPYIDFDFIRDATEHLYCSNNGRPAIPPEQLFKMLFVGYLFGIRSERQLVKDIEVNTAYRWFLGFSLTEKIPDASTISQNRRRRFAGSDIEKTIFEGIVGQALKYGFIDGEVLYTDSTHLKANANKRRHQVQDLEQPPMDYLSVLDEAIDEDREAHGKKPLAAKPPEAKYE